MGDAALPNARSRDIAVKAGSNRLQTLTADKSAP